MSFRSNIFPTGRQFHFNPAGEDRLNGKGLETAVETPTRAIERVNALNPVPSAQLRASIVSSADGVYADGLLLPPFTTFNAPSTSVITTDEVNVTAASSQPVTIGSLLNFASDSTLYLIDGRDRVEANVETMVVGSAFATDCFGFVVSGDCSEVFIRLTTGSLRGPGATLIEHTASSPQPVDYNIDAVQFFDINQTLLCLDTPNATDQISLNITTAQMGSGAATAGSVMFDLKNGRSLIRAEALQAETLFNLSGGELGLNVQLAVGAMAVDAGCNAVVNVGLAIGDITVDGTMQCVINQHVGAITENGTINGWINGEPYGNAQEKVVLQGSEFTNQVPTGTDVPMQIKFGPSQGTAGDPVTLSAAGAITANKAKKYLVDVVVSYGRLNAGSASWLFFRWLKNGVQFGDSLFAKLDNSNSDFPVQFSARLDLDAGDVATFEFVRDSQGFNDGELISETPTLIGWNPAPSASITVTI